MTFIWSEIEALRLQPCTGMPPAVRVTMNERPKSMYEKVGGESGVESLVLVFYSRVLADGELAPFFKQTSFAKLYAMQREFFGMALGGPMEYTGAALAKAHHGRGISSRHFGRFATHLLATLKEKGLDEDEAQTVIDRINSFANEITGTSY